MPEAALPAGAFPVAGAAALLLSKVNVGSLPVGVTVLLAALVSGVVVSVVVVSLLLHDTITKAANAAITIFFITLV